MKKKFHSLAKKIPVDTLTSDTSAKYYLPLVITAQDYYPFGMLEPGRNINTTGFRFGFNGMEKDDDIYGAGNAYDYGMRMYDARLGRPLSIDPLFKKYPELSTYQFFSDNPILNIDIDGLEGVVSQTLNNGGYTTAISSTYYTQIKPTNFIVGYTGGAGGTVSQYEPGAMEKVRTYLKSPSSNPITWAAKFGGKMAYNTVNDVVIYGTNIVYGPEGARDLEGHGVDKKQITDAFVYTVGPIAAGGMIGQLAKDAGAVKSASDFSTANKGTSVLSDSKKAGEVLKSDNNIVRDLKSLPSTIKSGNKTMGIAQTASETAADNRNSDNSKYVKAPSPESLGY